MQNPGIKIGPMVTIKRIPNASITTINLKLNRKTLEILNMDIKNDVAHL